MIIAMKDTPRNRAKANGSPTYTAEKRCQRDHEPIRRTSNGNCVGCNQEASKRTHIERYKDPARVLENRLRVLRWQKENPEKYRARVAAWRARPVTKAQQAARIAKWERANPDKVKLISVLRNHRRRMRKIANGGSFTKDDVVFLQTKQRGKCAACLKRVRRLEVDHIHPVARGGTDERCNLQLLCKSCNSSKGAKESHLWAQLHGRLI